MLFLCKFPTAPLVVQFNVKQARVSGVLAPSLSRQKEHVLGLGLPSWLLACSSQPGQRSDRLGALRAGAVLDLAGATCKGPSTDQDNDHRYYFWEGNRHACAAVNKDTGPPESLPRCLRGLGLSLYGSCC